MTKFRGRLCWEQDQAVDNPIGSITLDEFLNRDRRDKANNTLLDDSNPLAPNEIALRDNKDDDGESGIKCEICGSHVPKVFAFFDGAEEYFACDSCFLIATGRRPNVSEQVY